VPSLVKKYNEALDIMLFILKDFSSESILTMKNSIKVIEEFHDIFDTDASKISTLYYDFCRLDELYKIEEAVEIGFKKFLIKNIKETKSMLDYHNHNCKTSCIICETRKKMEGELFERKRPKIPKKHKK
tara:strand:- start:2214 stop:2600 length:387 start_codon:yes stop_codon:yes gene_type:complete